MANERGRVYLSTGSWYEVLTEAGKKVKARLRGKHKIAGLKATNPIAVGDFVSLIPEDEGVYTIQDIEQRRNYIIRQSPHKANQHHLIAANLDQTVLVATLTYPRTSTGFIDRFLVSAEQFRIPAIVVFNKTDIYEKKENTLLEKLMHAYTRVGYTCLAVSAEKGEGLENILEMLKGKTTLFSGHSGVGKSTLLNTLFPELDLRIGELSDYTEKGQHTTTFAEMFEPLEGMYLIDTPGIKELGMADVEKAEIAHFFPEFRALIGECRFHNCSHLQEPGCAVRQGLEEGSIAEFRYINYLNIMDELDNKKKFYSSS